MPYAIDEEKFGKLENLDKGNPPVKMIPHLEFPKCVYRYPKSATKEIVEVIRGQVITTIVPAMALSKVVADAKDLAQALKEGWHKEPWQPPVVEDPALSAEYE